MPSVLILGATGFIGGSVLVGIKNAFPNFDIRAFVRNPVQNELVLSSGATSTINPPSSEPAAFFRTIETSSAEVDVVVNCASADDLQLMEAILRGMKTKFQKEGRSGALVHTSGVGVFLDSRTDGEFDPNGKYIQDFLNRPQAWHANVDILVLKAGEEGYVNTYMIAPGAMPGKVTGPVNTVGLVYYVLATMKELRHPFYFGDGTSVFGTVHISDLVILFTLVLKKAVSESRLPSLPTSPYARYYVGSAQDVPLNWSAPIYGEALYRHGLISSPEPKSITAEEAGSVFGPVFGANSRTKPVRAARELGRKPREITKEMYDEFLDEVVKVMKSSQP